MLEKECNLALEKVVCQFVEKKSDTEFVFNVWRKDRGVTLQKLKTAAVTVTALRLANLDTKAMSMKFRQLFITLTLMTPVTLRV